MLKRKIKQALCKHEYESFILREPFYLKNSDEIFSKCKKCGKVKRRGLK